MKNAKLSKKIIITIIIVILVVVLVNLTSFGLKSGKSSTYQSWVDDSIAFVDRIISAPLRAFNAAIDSVHTVFETVEENEILKKKIDNYTNLEAQNKAYKEENNDLRDQLEMNRTLTNYDTVTTSVINRSPDNWQDILIVDAGSNQGVKEGMPVMGSKGLIGRVIQANKTSSKVQLLISKKDSAGHYPVMIQNEERSVYGLLNHYSSEDNAYVVNQLTSKKNIQEGDKVITSGLGGRSPKGLYIGQVVKVKQDSYGLNKEVYVRPAEEMYDLSVVTIVKRLATESGE